MKSMTGYGEASSEHRGTKITVQVRSLNHRHLDLQLRVPREYLSFEEEIRKLIRDRVHRGRVDVFVNRAPVRGRTRRLLLDEDLLGQYLASIQKAKKRFKLAGQPELSLLSTLPDLFRVEEVDARAAAEKRGLFRCLGLALRRLDQARGREGRELQADMRSQLVHLRRIAADLEARAAAAAARLQRIPGEANGGALESEAGETAGPAPKGDVNEEIVRLKSHIAALFDVLREREPVGKKIDFMLQEIQRELNTIGSKQPQLPIVQLVLQGKERVEKIREQSQNVE
ncbi:MAG TPA: YicC/YloC family endoribonuclease [candidate division Zixibacteria bacterium]|nr:YicC/YloC family endoribonuclease [candidate division Zixibacteria bacterium]